MELSDDIRSLKGIGDKTAALFGKLGISTISGLLQHFPRSYDVYRVPVCINELKEGYVGSVECTVADRPRVIRKGRISLVTLRLNDGTGTLSLTWFNQPYLAGTVKPGSRYIFRGTISSRRSELKMIQPQIFEKSAYLKKMSELQPVYPLCSGISNNMIIKSMHLAAPCIHEFKDYLTRAQANALDLYDLTTAMERIHFPLDMEDCNRARRRLVFDDFFTFLAMGRIMKRTRELTPNRHRITDNSMSDSLISSLPYDLTGAQLRAIGEIRKDLASDYSSTRLLQGDVGSGKTIVAVCTLLDTVHSGAQGCIMVPTDVLARQHYEDIGRLLSSFGVRTELITGSMTAAQKRTVRDKIASHKADILIGTHAVIEDSVVFDDLAVAVIDEQHRFGVRQRELIRTKGADPYILVMSATPIPRSLAIILYGDMQLSIIDEMPKNRLPIKNCVISSDKRSTSYNFIRARIAEGRQAYIICPMIEESEELDAENVTEYSERLKDTPGFENINIGVLHGRLKKDEKESILAEFYSGRCQVLVSTTVVEVGVNVPNATVMMVENAERFGLAQLHQLRGRVGRGSEQSYCIFVKAMSGEKIDERLDILVKYNDGMKVAEKDLELRGPGELFGIRQSGELGFRMADLIGDASVLQLATTLLNSLSDEELDRMTGRCPYLFNPINSLGDVL